LRLKLQLPRRSSLTKAINDSGVKWIKLAAVRPQDVACSALLRVFDFIKADSSLSTLT